MATIIDPHFAESAVQVEVSAGLSVEGIVRQCDIPEAVWANVVIVLNGIEVVRAEWGNVYPIEADIISVHVVPFGGEGGKTILRLVAVIAISIAAPGIGTYLSNTALGTSLGVSAAVATGIVTVVGSLVVNALIPPASIKGTGSVGASATSNAYFLSGQSNRARPYEIVPVTYGTHKLYANLASSPQIFSAGTSSVFQAVYDFGLGSYQVQDVKVGDTSLDVFEKQQKFFHVLAPEPNSTASNSTFKDVDLQIYGLPS